MRRATTKDPSARSLPHAGGGACRGFTLIELLAAMVIVALLLATFVPYAMSLREAGNRVRCASNLSNINRALREYAAGNGYVYPRVRFDPRMGNRWTAFTGAHDGNPFSADSAVSSNDVTASLWLLVREGLAQPEWFVCPSAGGRADRIVDVAGGQTVVKRRGNFRSAEHLGYAYASPFSAVGDYRLNDTLPARFALLADRGPSPETLEHGVRDGLRFDSDPKSFKAINSPNHRGAGQNVLYADGTVRFEWSPYSGVRRPPANDADRWAERNDGDNLYTALRPTPLTSDVAPNEPGTAGPSVGPSYKYDTVLVPYAGFKADPSPSMMPATSPATSPATQP